MTDTLRHTRPEGHDSEIRVGPPPRTSGGPRREPRIPSWALKVAAAVTGIIWAIFLAIHFYGNLKVFQGPEAFNNYAHWLKNAFYPLMPHEGVLWLMRAVLVPSLIIHVIAVFLIWQRARRSRADAAAGDRAGAAVAGPVAGERCDGAALHGRAADGAVDRAGEGGPGARQSPPRGPLRRARRGPGAHHRAQPHRAHGLPP